jgi:hypothetical protein
MIQKIIEDTKNAAPHIFLEHEVWGHTFYRVGWNSTHEFYLGHVDGQACRVVMGEGGLLDPDDPYGPVVSEYYADPVRNSEDVGYIGHW